MDPVVLTRLQCKRVAIFDGKAKTLAVLAFNRNVVDLYRQVSSIPSGKYPGVEFINFDRVLLSIDYVF